ncbi:Uncharacterized protein PECH_008706 [Penicillium ucsense]|uniref:Uncharacterized protein n=1 Tax=Penicillium ucsense TaxID=2839758 RepID=A0A8J8W1H3_9EURO|nr:Uncharacterized protein PECM_006137 [Penicillium ucsense]KAF7734046.1 Uncharacterized protein PECH_008706 [Penicillium ucsense]
MAFLKNLTLFGLIASLATALPQHARPTATATLVPVTSSTSVTPSATPTATGTSSSSGSGINIVNNLNQTVYLWSISNTGGDMQTLPASGGTYTEKWRINSDGGGISIKMATTTSLSSVLQFEYTKGDDTLWWDLSSINLASDSPFISSGFQVTTDDSSCSSATCHAGDVGCKEAYQKPDDVDTRSCSSSAAFTLVLG